MIRTTHTFATLSVSPAAFNEIWTKLQAAGYQDSAVQQDDGPLVIDMHGIGLTATSKESSPRPINMKAKQELIARIMNDHRLNGIATHHVMLHIEDLEMYLKRYACL